MATTLLRFASRALRPKPEFRRFSAAVSVPDVRRNNQTELKNGLRVATEDTGGATVGVNVTIDVGSRHETEDTSGTTALWLHSMLDKANAQRLASIGAQLTGQVGRDKTWLSVHCLSADLKAAVEVLGQLVTNTDFGLIDQSRQRLLQRMRDEDGDGEVVAMNSLYSMAFQNTGLSLPAVGRSHVVDTLTRDHLLNHVSAHVKGPRVVVSAVGDVDHNECVRAVEQHFGSVTATYDRTQVPIHPRSRYTGSDIRIRDDAMPLAHIAIAVEGSPITATNDRIALELSAALLGQWDRSFGGGTDVSSYLALCSSADHLTHSFRAFSHSFADTGLFGCYLVVERMKQEDVIWHLLYEWKRFCQEITENELIRAKNTILTQNARQEQHPVVCARNVGSQVLAFGRRVPFGEWRDHVLAVDARKVRDVLTEHVWDRCPVVAGFGPIEQLEDYEVLRGKFYWFRY
ncbi:cytochrome b-c1 complex subunit 1, mitochondrial-like [Oppia nitens]|uniref:cytochrome b-c1 complex subunit 1, mitochondrial-like n=1 Tax=Oppia nitens TaxID=1686743 RepID=UPI0023DA0EAB|nr:cytochrome b-c1 complex subunit 1, mitochondrial-like [Oppia nitens]